jgi:DNA-binding transcriptional ArsR family regulator
MEIDRTFSAARVRAAAHPLRLRLLEVLREGPATASQLARRLDESSGATSYHLRVLARHGLVEDEPAGRRGRERPWRRVDERMTIVGAAPADEPEYEAAVARLREVFLERDEQALAAFLTGRDAEGAWAEASFVGGWTVYATVDEIQELTRTLLERIDPLRRAPDERPPGARRIYVTWRALPQRDD